MNFIKSSADLYCLTSHIWNNCPNCFDTSATLAVVAFPGYFSVFTSYNLYVFLATGFKCK